MEHGSIIRGGSKVVELPKTANPHIEYLVPHCSVSKIRLKPHHRNGARMENFAAPFEVSWEGVFCRSLIGRVRETITIYLSEGSVRKKNFSCMFVADFDV
jgi:hypothetical protein